MLVQKRQPKTPTLNSGYYRITGDVQLAYLLQKAHSCVIANGNELEDKVLEHSQIANKLDKYEFKGDNWLQPKPGDVFLVQKFKFVKGVLSDKGTEIDFALVTSKEVHFFELKDGSNFDTKKSSGEYDKIVAAAKYSEKNDPFRRTHYKSIVFWNAKDFSEVSFKDKRAAEENVLMLGKDFADLVKVNYNKLNLTRLTDRKDNKNYILEEMLEMAKAEGMI